MSDRVRLVCGGPHEPSRLPGLLRCCTCGFITADVNLSTEELEGLYSADYFAGREYKDYLGERPVIERHFKERLRTLRRQIGQGPQSRLFEIGCAYGFFLSVAQHHYANVAGIDISADAVAYARQEMRLNVTAGDFLDHAVDEPVDAVCMWDTIEHLADPDRYIQKAAAILKPGGHIALTTADIGSLVARFRGRKWRQIRPPTHLHYFSRATLIRLLEKHGLRVKYCGYDGMYRSVETMAYIVLAIRNDQPRLYEALKRSGLLNWNLYINLFDILFIIAEKRPDESVSASRVLNAG